MGAGIRASIFLLAVLVLTGIASPRPQNEAHVGPVDSAIVGIEVITSTADGAAKQIRRGNGLLIRCDGFILAPSALFYKTVNIGGQSEPAAEQSITVVTSPGTPGAKRLSARAPRFTPRDVGYSVIKLPGFHALCAVTALPPDSGSEGDIVVAYSRFDSVSRQFMRVERSRATAGAAPPDSERIGVTPLAISSQAAPAGAVVVGRSDSVIGMCTSAGAAGPVEFTSTEGLHLATNCVTPLPQKRPENPDMVPVQGGAIGIPLSILGAQPDLESAATACMPAFEIDRLEVTNQEYMAYWDTLPESSKRSLGFRSNYYPWTWAQWPASPPFPAEIARFPVLGVPVTGARGYARWRGKRLPTPYEWYLAAMGPRGIGLPPEWIGRFLNDKKVAWDRLKYQHIEQLRFRRELQQEGHFVQGQFRIPWLALTALSAEPSAWSSRLVQTTLAALWATWQDPYYVRAVGTREYDRGHSGMMDALLNASELAAPYPGPAQLGNARYFELQWLPPKDNPIDDPWYPVQIEALTGDRQLQPLSRLYRRTYHGPSVEDLIAWSNLSEAAMMLRVNRGWALAYTNESLMNATMKPPDKSAYAQLARPAGLKLWQELPPHTSREMGREAPLQGPGDRGAPGPQLYYYLPVGFRCAR